MVMALAMAPLSTPLPHEGPALLVTRANDRSYDDFFVAEYQGVVNLLRSMGVDEAAANDASQDAFIRAYARWGRLSSHASPEAWVRRVAINRSRDAFRSEARRSRREERAAPRELATASPEATVSSTDSVRSLLASLPRRQREVATLFYVQDLAVRDIGDILGISDGAVKFHLNRARTRLETALREQDES